MRWFPPLIAAMALLALVTGAQAQGQRAFSIQNFQAAPGYGSFFTVEGASVPDGLAIRVGGFANYQYRPLMVRGCERVEGGDCVEWSDGGTALVAHHLTLEPLGAISMYGLLEVGLALPIVLYQEGEDAQVAGGPDVVARVFERNPKMEMRIEGHTDSKGKRDHNLDLSQRRANAVKRYLVEKGIDEKRLEAIGHGPDKPIEDNKTKKGRAANRRVEFHITND